jgi:hypothetical protein
MLNGDRDADLIPNTWIVSLSHHWVKSKTTILVYDQMLFLKLWNFTQAEAYLTFRIHLVMKINRLQIQTPIAPVMIIYIECVINRTPLSLLSLTCQPRNRVIFVYFYGQMMSSVVITSDAFPEIVKFYPSRGIFDIPDSSCNENKSKDMFRSC